MDENEIYDLLDRFNVDHVILDYNCGGDDTTIYCDEIYDLDGNRVNSYELGSYFEEYALENFNFMDASDNHYMGESGTIKIKVIKIFRDKFINENDDEEEEEEEEMDYYYDFTHEKEGFYHYREKINFELNISLDISTIVVIKKNVSSLYGGDKWIRLNLKNGINVSEKEMVILNELKEKIEVCCAQFEPQTDHEILDFYNFSISSEDDDEILFSDDGIKVIYTAYYDNDVPS
jgi:hypothetical protein